MRRKFRIWIPVLACVLLASGCGKKKADTQGEVSEVVEIPATEQVIDLDGMTETHEGQAVSDLTGEWIDAKLAKKRPIAIMTENTKITQPQYGVGKADIYYECPMEGGLTRMMAIYQDYSGMDRIGNVRSARNYFVYYAREFDAIYYHCGQSHFAKELVDSDFIDNLNAITGKAEPYYYRTDDRKAPHNLYTSSKLIKQSIKDYGYWAKHGKDYEAHYQFAKDGEKTELADGVPAEKVEVYFPVNKPWFEYNESDGLYYRFQYEDKQVDGLTDAQLAVANIIIQDCDVYVWEESTEYMYVDVMAGGTGKFITGGKCIDITWKKESETKPTRYYDSDGKEITLNQGKTWIEIVDEDHRDRHVISGKGSDAGQE